MYGDTAGIRLLYVPFRVPASGGRPSWFCRHNTGFADQPVFLRGACGEFGELSPYTVWEVYREYHGAFFDQAFINSVKSEIGLYVVL